MGNGDRRRAGGRRSVSVALTFSDFHTPVTETLLASDECVRFLLHTHTHSHSHTHTHTHTHTLTHTVFHGLQGLSVGVMVLYCTNCVFSLLTLTLKLTGCECVCVCVCVCVCL